MWETQVQFLGGEDLLEKEMATHSSILAWKIPWTEEPGRLQSMGSQRVRHDFTFTFIEMIIQGFLYFLLWYAHVFSNESTLHMRWPKYCSFSFSINPSNEHPGLTSFRMDWLDLLAVQGALKSLLLPLCITQRLTI